MMKESPQTVQISEQKKTIGQVLNELQTGSFFSIDKVKPVGALQARRQGDGAVMFYWRYTIGTRESNKSERIKIGIYDSTAPVKSHTPGKKGYSVLAAMKFAEAMAIEHAEHREEGGRPALKLAELAAAVAEVAKAESEAKHTLINLLYGYCDLLQTREQVSHKDARGIFRLHVAEAFPDLAKAQANTITSKQVATILRTLTEAGKPRTANKLRAYAGAAYKIALTAEFDPSVPIAFQDFKVIVNPVLATVQDKKGNQADKNPLTPKEMIQYWMIIKNVKGIKGSILRFHLLTGGQRIEQLVNLLCQDVNKSEKFVKIYDSKGKNHVNREHFVPLLPEALAELQSIESSGTYALTTETGKTHVNALTLTRWASAAVGTSIDEFKLKRVRSGVETLLANQQVSQETRGRLQSHGITGIQNAHYNAYDYTIEKHQALQTLLDTLNEKIEIRKYDSAEKSNLAQNARLV